MSAKPLPLWRLEVISQVPWMQLTHMHTGSDAREHMHGVRYAAEREGERESIWVKEKVRKCMCDGDHGVWSTTNIISTPSGCQGTVSMAKTVQSSEKVHPSLRHPIVLYVFKVWLIASTHTHTLIYITASSLTCWVFWTTIGIQIYSIIENTAVKSQTLFSIKELNTTTKHQQTSRRSMSVLAGFWEVASRQLTRRSGDRQDKQLHCLNVIRTHL